MGNSPDITMIDGEVVVVGLQTAMYIQKEDGSWISAWLSSLCEQIRDTILGVRRIGRLTITDRRVIIEKHQRILWCFDSEMEISTIMPNAIASMSYSFEARHLCCCRRYLFKIKTMGGEIYEFYLKKGKKQAEEISNAALGMLLRHL